MAHRDIMMPFNSIQNILLRMYSTVTNMKLHNEDIKVGWSIQPAMPNWDTLLIKWRRFRAILHSYNQVQNRHK